MKNKKSKSKQQRSPATAAITANPFKTTK